MFIYTAYTCGVAFGVYMALKFVQRIFEPSDCSIAALSPPIVEIPPVEIPPSEISPVGPPCSPLPPPPTVNPYTPHSPSNKSTCKTITKYFSNVVNGSGNDNEEESTGWLIIGVATAIAAMDLVAFVLWRPKTENKTDKYGYPIARIVSQSKADTSNHMSLIITHHPHLLLLMKNLLETKVHAQI